MRQQDVCLQNDYKSFVKSVLTIQCKKGLRQEVSIDDWL